MLSLWQLTEIEMRCGRRLLQRGVSKADTEPFVCAPAKSLSPSQRYEIDFWSGRFKIGYLAHSVHLP